jgi:hypothetical protein
MGFSVISFESKILRQGTFLCLFSIETGVSILSLISFWEDVMLGKKKCRILKEIRQKIADENDIPYVTHECKFQGECKGTCPRCESELKYLEKQLAARAAAGKRIAIAALCAGMTFSMAGCASPFANNKGGDKSGTEDLAGMMEGPEEVYVTTGEVAPPEDTGEEGGQEGSTEKDNTSGQDSTGKDNTSGQDSTGKEDISGHGSTSGTEDPEEYQLMGDVVYSVEEDLAL